MPTDRSFEGALPRLIESLDDVDIEIFLLAEREYVLDHLCLIRRRWQGTFTHAAGARPAGFPDENFLARKCIDDLPANGVNVRPGLSRGNRKVLPIGQDMNGDEIDGIGDVAIAQPEFPDVRIGHRDADPRLDRADGPREVGRRHVAAQKHLVAHDNGPDGPWIFVRERDGRLYLEVAFCRMTGQPQALHDLQAIFGCDAGDLVEAEINRVGADAVRDFR